MTPSAETTRKLFNALADGKKRPWPQDTFVFLVDGSESMRREKLQGEPLLKTAVAAVKVIFREMPQESLALGLWGEGEGLITVSKKFLLDEKNKKALDGGLKCGSYLSPSVDDLATLAEKLPQKTRLHAVILSGGAVFDPESSAKALKKLFALHKNMTLDALTFSPSDPRLTLALDAVAAEFPGRVTTAAFREKPSDLAYELCKTMIRRKIETRKGAPPPKKPVASHAR